MSSSRFDLLVMVASFLMLAAPAASAGVSVEGTLEAVHLEVKNASIEEVLRALGDAYGLTYKSNLPLGKEANGTYRGPLSRVLARLLEDSNFVLTHNGKTFQIVIISPAGPKPKLSSPSVIAAPRSIPEASPASTLAARLFPPPTPTSPSTR